MEQLERVKLREQKNSSNKIVRYLKQAKINKYWLSTPVLTTNRFETLDNMNNEKVDQAN